MSFLAGRTNPPLAGTRLGRTIATTATDIWDLSACLTGIH